MLADTHLRREPPPGSAWLRAAANADLIVHAGDLSSVAALRALQELGPLAAVQGNVDDPALRELLPADLVIDLGGISIGVVHDAGPARGRLERLRASFPGTGAVVFGHSHVPLHESAADGFQIFNPGSPTQRRRQLRHSMGLAELSGDSLAFRHVAV